MTGRHWGVLRPEQREAVSARFPDIQVIERLDWPLNPAVVLHVRSGADDLIVKASVPEDNHLRRELRAHEQFVSGLGDGWQRLRFADQDACVLVFDYVPGVLVEGTPAEFDADTHRQAGVLLAAIHASGSAPDSGYDRQATQRALSWLDTAHPLPPNVAHAARQILEHARTPLGTNVPTHGDWQPRNWLIADGDVRAIDFGRFDHRPAFTDLVRLAVQQWRGRPELEAAFLDGYGEDPRDTERWRLELLRQGVTTAAWAQHVGDENFAAQGVRMTVEALEAF